MSTNSPPLFVDAHCHLFNLVDVPLYETLNGQVSMNTAAKLLAVMAPSPMLIGFATGALHDNKEFLQFFERPQVENMRSLARQIKTSSKAEQVVMTPLVMDFDCIRHEKCGSKGTPCTSRECPLLKEPDRRTSADPSAEGQYRRLKESVAKLNGENDQIEGNVKVFPFLGFDLRKLTPQNGSGLARLQSLWAEVGTTQAERDSGFSNIENGKALGIKLYPPIGFNPCPRGKPKVLARYKEFYEWCLDEDIPIAVHCQTGSYSATRKKRQINHDTHASNWLRLFESWGKGALQSDKDITKLRINFAHFGGEDGLEDMLDWWRPGGIQKGTWTYILCQMLMTYPNAYADISAFDWASTSDVKNLLNLLKMDIQQKFPKGKLQNMRYSLREKLMWGSDVPMVVSEKSYRHFGDRKGKSDYNYLLQHFEESLEKIQDLTPDDPKELIRNLTAETPSKYLLR